MNEQKGSFQGIDTCDITNFGDFTFTSKLLSENESISICNRADMNDLLEKSEKYGFISQTVKDHIKEIAKSSENNHENMNKYLIGATYLSLHDSLILQDLLNKNDIIPINRDDEIINVKKSWSSFLYYVKKKHIRWLWCTVFILQKNTFHRK